MDNNEKYALLSDPDMKEIFDSFIVETREILESLDLDLVDMEKSPDDFELLNKVFRSFHTVKGTGGFLGLDVLTALTHRLEDILNKLRKGEAKLDSDIMDGILQAYDSLKELLVVIENNKNEDYDTSGTLENLERIIRKMEGGEGEPESENKEESEKSSQKVDSAESTPTGTDITEESTEEVLAEDETIEETEEKKTAESSNKPKTESAIAKVEKKVQVSKTVDNTIRVDVERLDDLLNIVSELVLGRNRLSQINADVSMQYEGTKLARDLGDTSKQIDLMTTELQLAVMKTRMIKIGKVFNKFPRLVRDLSKETKKEVELIIHGEETELDKTLIEEINDPLVHLIRNSVDHGVEYPEKRKEIGKNPVGKITLSAEHEGNNIIITIEDDGKGMDPNFLKEKAISKGLLSKEKAAELSRQDAFNLIFLPGFSTAEKVSNVSGRGVGMDVVKTNVTKLRGLINIESEVGVGTKIIIKFPLTLAIIQGLLVKLKGETVVIPLNSVVEVVRIMKDEVYVVNKTDVIKLRDTVLPLLNIDHLLYNATDDDEDKESQYIVVVGIVEKRYGIKVDMLIGQKEVVIKSLGNYLGNIKGLAGSTIMGDGKVVMILDIGEIISHIAETIE